MDSITTIARPYAKAAYEFAESQHEVPRWQAMLKLMADIVQDKTMQTVISRPDVDAKQLHTLFVKIAGEQFTENAYHLLALLIANKRLSVLPAIYHLFEEKRLAAERKTEASVSTAVPMSDALKNNFHAALKKAFEQDVDITYHIDEAILGGAVVRVGDKVIDASVRRQLDKLKHLFG